MENQGRKEAVWPDEPQKRLTSLAKSLKTCPLHLSPENPPKPPWKGPPTNPISCTIIPIIPLTHNCLFCIFNLPQSEFLSTTPTTARPSFTLRIPVLPQSPSLPPFSFLALEWLGLLDWEKSLRSKNIQFSKSKAGSEMALPFLWIKICTPSETLLPNSILV